MRALSDELDSLSVEELERHDPSYIQGVRVLYDAAGTPQRDETAFRHALKTAHRAHKRGQRLKDAPHHRRPRTRLPHRPRPRHPRPPRRNAPMRDRLTMARRVRAYATTNKTTKEAGTGLSPPGRGRTSSPQHANPGSLCPVLQAGLGAPRVPPPCVFWGGSISAASASKTPPSSMHTNTPTASPMRSTHGRQA